MLLVVPENMIKIFIKQLKFRIKSSYKNLYIRCKGQIQGNAFSIGWVGNENAVDATEYIMLSSISYRLNYFYWNFSWKM